MGRTGLRPGRRPYAEGEAPIEPLNLALAAARLADEKKAEDVQIIAVEDRLKVADYFVLMTGQNRAHVRALYNELHVRLKAAGETHRPVEGADLGWWTVLDYGDVVVHVFQPEAREFYDLEHLYQDCRRVDWQSMEAPELPVASEA